MLRLALIPIRLLSLLPLKALHALAVPAGHLLYWLPWAKHRVIRANLEQCFRHLDAATRRKLHRRYLIELWRLVLEAPVVWFWSKSRIERHVETRGLDAVLAAHAAGSGVMMVGGHIGNWELLNLYLSTRLPMVTLYRAPESPQLDAFITGPRERFGGRMAAGGGPAVRHLLTQLKSGGAIGVAADIQPKRGDGVFVEFFRTPALTMTLVNQLARRTGCAAFFTWAERLPASQGWRLHFEPAGDQLCAEDPAEALRPMNHWLEQAIHQAPEQYLWLYKRFSRTPDGNGNIYRDSELGTRE